VSEPKCPPLLLPLLAIVLAASACRSPAPPVAEPSAPELAAPEAEPSTPGLAIQPAPSVPTEAVPQDPSLVRVRSLLAARATRLAPPQRERIAETLVKVERESGISVLLLVALIEQESRFDPLAKGPRGSLGLMQVRPFVGEDFAARNGIPWQGPRTLFDPVVNVRIGTGYLVELLERFGSQERALAAYNMGPTRLGRRLARGDARTPAFVRRVLQDYEGLQREFASTEIGIGG